MLRNLISSKWIGLTAFLFLFSLCLLNCKGPDTQEEAQTITRYVTDEAGILGNTKTLNNDLARLKQTSGITFVVITKKEVENIEQLANDIFNKNKIGKEGKGVLLLISLKEKLYRVEIGRGLEGDIIDFDAKKASLLGVSKFKAGKFEEGIRDTISYILKIRKETK